MTTQITECIVHNRKYLSKFHGNINQLRRTNEFNVSILQQLPKRCCSCHEQTGESLFDLNHLRKLCQEIKTSQEPSLVTSDPVKPIHYVVLEFPPTLTPIQRLYKAGRFVGQNGQHLRVLERTLNVRINILSGKSNKHLCQMIKDLQTQNKVNHPNDLWILITMKNDEDNINKIKQSLQDAWKKIDVISRKGRSEKIRHPKQVTLPTADSVGDTRWKPKKQKPRDKYKSKQKQFDEQEEVQPQPLVRPISMPKEIPRPQKTKRR